MWSHDDMLGKIEHPGTFDLVVIGGGASGTGAALDAARRGLSVVLVEADDFGSQTSGRSTKLIHGGVRYLEQAIVKFDVGQLRQVVHGLRERRILLAQAPHLAQPLGLCTPCNSWWSFFYLRVGLQLYAMLAGWRDPLPSNRFLSRATFQKVFPALSEQFVGAVMYYDGHMDDARYCLALAKTAVQSGAVVMNHTPVVDFEYDGSGRVSGVVVWHKPTNKRFSIKAGVVLNATGAAADKIRLMANPKLPEVMRPSKGVHICVSRALVPAHKALLIPKTPDGRVVFAVPFGKMTMIGTTDTPWDAQSSTDCLTTADEVAYLLETIAPYLKEPVLPHEITAAFAGLRPLVNMPASGRSTAQLLRDHTVEVDHVSGLVSLLGGKWTTYRLMAQDAVDMICRILRTEAACTTDKLTLVGGGLVPGVVLNVLPADADLRNGLLARLGSEVSEMIDLFGGNAHLWQRILPDCPVCDAEIRYAVSCEMAVTLWDVLHQRLRTGQQDWVLAQRLAPKVAEILADELGWTDAERDAHLESYVAQIEKERHSLGISC